MFKSSEVVYLKPSNFKNKSCIFGIGKSFLLILLLSSLKSEMKLTVPFYFGIIKVEAAHLDLFLRFNTPMYINLLTSVFRVSSCILGNGIGLVWYGLDPSKSSILYSEPVKFSHVPSNNSSCFLNNFRIKDFLSLLRYFEILTIFFKLAFL